MTRIWAIWLPRLLSTPLLVAGALKLRAMALPHHTEQLPGMTALGCLEIGVGLSLFLASHRRGILVIGTIMFSALAAVSFRALLARADCGCFGDLHVPAQCLLAFDIASAAILAINAARHHRPATGELALSFRGLSKPAAANATTRTPLLTVIAFTLPLMGLFYFGASSYGRPEDPVGRIGEQSPLLGASTVNGALRAAKCNVFLYRSDCGECSGDVTRFLNTARGRLRLGNGVDLIAIDVSAGHDRTPPRCAHFPGVLFGQLDNPSRWFLQSPTLVTLKRGVVESTCPLGKH